MRGGYKEKFNTIHPPLGGGSKTSVIVSDFPPGYKDKEARTAIRKMKHKGHKHKKKHRKH
jgi:hypothetical protein